MTSSSVENVASLTIGNKLRRLIWRAVEIILYRWSPVPMHFWRRFLLRMFGAEIAATAHPYPTATIWAPWNLKMGENTCLAEGVICYNVAAVELGVYARVSQYAYLCSAGHDIRSPSFDLRVGRIVISDGAWVAAGAFIGPGVTVGAKAVVGARAVVTKDVQDGYIVGGNPASKIGDR